MGPAPIINKENLSRKVTIALHQAASDSDQVKEGEFTKADAEEMVDDILTISNLDFLGKGSVKFNNQHDSKDIRNGKFCTVPTKLTFRSKDDRIKAEQSLRGLCGVKCSTL